MKKHLIVLVIIFACFLPQSAYCAVTTTDNSITLDFYEDTQSGIPNRWILDFTVNDLGSFHPEYFEELIFAATIYNPDMFYDNEYNILDTEYYNIADSSLEGPDGKIGFFIQNIYPDSDDLPTPVGTKYTFYAMPRGEGEPIIGNFSVDLSYIKNIGSEMHEQLTLTGPIGFAPVPEPMSMLLFVFGAFFLRFITI